MSLGFERSIEIFCKIFLCVIFLLIAPNAYCNPWHKGTDVVINIQSITHTEKTTYAFISHKNGDTEISIHSEAIPNGLMLLLAGKYLLVKDIDLPQGAETDAMDYGGLMYQLVAKILGKALPKGALEVSMKKEINISEKKESIKVATTSSKGVFSAPWRANGYVVPSNEKIQYDIKFECNNSHGQKSRFKLSGYWSDAVRPGISNEYSLKNFRVYKLGPKVTEKTAEFGGTIQEKKFSTVGEFRNYIGNSKP